MLQVYRQLNQTWWIIIMDLQFTPVSTKPTLLCTGHGHRTYMSKSNDLCEAAIVLQCTRGQTCFIFPWRNVRRCPCCLRYFLRCFFLLDAVCFATLYVARLNNWMILTYTCHLCCQEGYELIVWILWGDSICRALRSVLGFFARWVISWLANNANSLSDV